MLSAPYHCRLHPAKRTPRNRSHWLGNVPRETIIWGGNNRTVSCVPTALYILYFILIVSSISNLRAMTFSPLKIINKTNALRLDTYSIINYWNWSQNNNTYSSKYGNSLSRTCGLQFIVPFWRHFLVCFRRSVATLSQYSLLQRKVDLRKKSEEAISSRSINISELDTYIHVSIVSAKSITTKFDPTILLTIHDSYSAADAL